MATEFAGSADAINRKSFTRRIPARRNDIEIARTQPNSSYTTRKLFVFSAELITLFSFSDAPMSPSLTLTEFQDLLTAMYPSAEFSFRVTISQRIAFLEVFSADDRERAKPVVTLYGDSLMQIAELFQRSQIAESDE